MLSKNNTTTFLSQDRTVGVCKSDPSTSGCCENPATVTGDFQIDLSLAWNTDLGFNYPQTMYGVSMIGLQYNNDEWMGAITKTSKSFQTLARHSLDLDEDYVVYSLLVWAIYSVYLPAASLGSLRVGLTGDAGVMFDRKYFTSDYGNYHNMQGTPESVQTAIQFDSFTQNLQVATSIVMDSKYCNQIVQMTCFPDSTLYILNRMGTFLQPVDFDKSGGGLKQFIAEWKVDITSIVAAAAVNLKIIPTSALIPADDLEMKEFLIKNNMDNIPEMKNLSSYFGKYDKIYAKPFIYILLCLIFLSTCSKRNSIFSRIYSHLLVNIYFLCIDSCVLKVYFLLV